MKKILLLSLGMLVSTNYAFASGTHDGGHAEKMAVGKPGKAGHENRTIKIIMKETDDGDMIFIPNHFSVKKGETIKFDIKNKGELEHEFVLDTHKEVMKHKAVMEKFPEMEHDDPNAVRLEEGKSGKIYWTFSNSGKFEFACLIPGHYEAGMKGDIKVSNQSPQTN